MFSWHPVLCCPWLQCQFDDLKIQTSHFVLHQVMRCPWVQRRHTVWNVGTFQQTDSFLSHQVMCGPWLQRQSILWKLNHQQKHCFLGHQVMCWSWLQNSPTAWKVSSFNKSCVFYTIGLCANRWHENSTSQQPMGFAPSTLCCPCRRRHGKSTVFNKSFVFITL